MVKLHVKDLCVEVVFVSYKEIYLVMTAVLPT